MPKIIKITFHNSMKIVKTISLLSLLSAVPFTAGAETLLQTTFSQETGLQGWTTADSNGDGASWQLSPALNGLVYNGLTTTQQASDWAFSPAVELTAGSHYTLEVTTALRGSLDTESTLIAIGAAANAEAMTTTISEDSYDFHSGMVTRRYHFVPATSGAQHIGIKATSAAACGLISIKSISIADSEGQMPLAAPDLTLGADPVAKSVTLRWYTPQSDVIGCRITRPMAADIRIDGNTVATVDNLAPAALCEKTIYPEELGLEGGFSGEHEFSIVVKLDGLESDACARDLNLNDFIGERVTIATHKVSSQNKWLTEKGATGPEWNFDYTSYYIGYSSNADSWLITPGVTLQAGHRYVLDYEVKSNKPLASTFNVTVGAEQTAAAQSKILVSHVDMTTLNYETLETPQFEVDADGNYFFGFNAKVVKNELAVRSISVIEVIDGAAAGEQADPVWPETTETILADNDNPGLDISFPYHTRLTPEGVDIYAAFTQAQIDQFTLAPEGIFRLDYDKQYAPELTTPEYEATLGGGCTYHNGKIYTINYKANGNVQEEVPHWQVIDAITYEVLVDVELPSGGVCTTRCLAYNPADGYVYGFVRDFTDTHLVRIDTATGEMTRIRSNLDFSKRFLSIACSADGALYALYLVEDYSTGDQRHFLTRINAADGTMADMGEIQGANMMKEDVLYNMKYRQALVFNNADGKLYWFMASSSVALGSQYAAVFEVNPISAVATLRTWFTDVYAISGVYFTEPATGVPASITDCAFTPETIGATTGKLSFDMPAVTYSGKALDGTIQYRVVCEEEDCILLEGEAAPGAHLELPISAAQGIHALTLTASNAAGSSVPVTRNIVVGYDNPKAPTNISIEEQPGRHIILTWTAPETGVNGAPYAPAAITYAVFRNAGASPIAEGLTQCKFEETLPSNLAMYVYTIYSCYNGKRIEGAQSKAVVVGDPITPPYGGIFENMNDMFDHYTILDENNDRHTWVFETQTSAAVYPYNYDSPADDWLISPPLTLNAGRMYTLKFGTFSSNEQYLEHLKVYMGNGKTPTAQNVLLLDLPEVPTLDEDGQIATYQLDFEVPADGTYYYSFYACSEAFKEYLFVYDISIFEKENGGVDAPTILPDIFTALAVEGGVQVINPKHLRVEVYATNGIKVASTTADNETISLNPGLYFVTAGRQSYKIVVR